MAEVTEQEANEAVLIVRSKPTIANRYDNAADLLSKFVIQELARREAERAAQAEFNARVESVLDRLVGSRESYRSILTDKDRLLRKLCEYANRRARNIRCEPWSIVGQMFGHGSGVSSAIYELYRERDEAEVKAEGGAS